MEPRQQREPVEAPQAEVQQSDRRSIARDEELKRMIKQHPQRDIPRIESVEPSEAPSKE